MTQAPLSAIIDIGSNSIRLVVYDGPRRAPAVLFNEKVLAGLGAGLAETGLLAETAIERAMGALARYQLVLNNMGVTNVRVVATAAVREAKNAAVFLEQIAALGFKVAVLSGDEEAKAAGYGVISAIPEADGIVGDLGGGSLELVRVRGGVVHDYVSLPIGVLRSRSIVAKGMNALEEHIQQAVNKVDWIKGNPNLPFYLVGGSWRTLARFHMRMSDYPLPVIHHYEMPQTVGGEIMETLGKLGPQELKAKAAISASRAPTLGDAAAILTVVAKILRPSQFIVSANGLREGLLYLALDTDEQKRDPLVEAARAEGARMGRFAEHGRVLHDWMSPLFAGESDELGRLRLATCLLSDVGWHANPDFRAERGVDVALHGNWIGVDARGRALIAQALFTGFGGGQSTPPILAQLASREDLSRAVLWGLAVRLGQRLSAGLAEPLQKTALATQNDELTMCLPKSEAALIGDVVERRFKNLATAMKLTPRVLMEH